MAKRKLRAPVKAGLYLIALSLVSGVLYRLAFSPALKGESSQVLANNASSESSESENAESSQPEEYGYPIAEDTGEKSATILVDAGHGGSDNGDGSSDGLMEKNITLDFAKKLKTHLEHQNPNINVLLVRDGDTIDWADNEWDDLVYRQNLQETTGADYFISLHAHTRDDPASYGAIFYLNDDDDLTRALASKISENFTAIGWPSNGEPITMEQYPLLLISMSNTHALEIDLGSLNNPENTPLFHDETLIDHTAAALANAISSTVLDNPDAPAYSSRQKEVERTTREEEARQASLEVSRQEEERKKSEEAEKKKKEEEAKKASSKK